MFSSENPADEPRACCSTDTEGTKDLAGNAGEMGFLLLRPGGCV